MSCLKIVPNGYVNLDASQGLIHGYIYPKSKYCGGMSVDPSHAAAQMEMVRKYWCQNYGRRLRHFVLSFTPDESIHLPSFDYVIRAAYEICAYYAKDYQIIFGIHTTPHLHIHFVMNMICYKNGKRFQARFADDAQLASHIRNVISLPVEIVYF